MPGWWPPGGVDTPIYAQAATYGDAVGGRPFPVTTPERVAHRVLGVADHPWHRRPGNVMTSQQDGNALRGGWGNALVGIARNLGELGRRRSSG